MEIKDIRKLINESRAAFGRRYNIPIRTLENWESGKSDCPEYVKELLLRAVAEDAEKIRKGEMRMKYYVIENRNIGLRGMPEFVETVKFVTEDKRQAVRYEHELRKTYKDRGIVDCYTMSEKEREEAEEQARESKKIWESMTEEEKNDIIEVDGKRYFRKIYEKNKNKKMEE